MTAMVIPIMKIRKLQLNFRVKLSNKKSTGYRDVGSGSQQNGHKRRINSQLLLG